MPLGEKALREIMGSVISFCRPGRSERLRWVALGLTATFLVILLLWVAVSKQGQNRAGTGEPGSEYAEPVFEKKNIEIMDIAQLKAYVRACERAGDIQECERAYQRAIRLTEGETSQFKEFIDFSFGLAALYLNSLWEYGQFGGAETIPPAITRAMKIYDEIIASNPGSELAAEAQFRRGLAFHNEFSGYWNRLHRGDAIREFQRVIEFYPGTDQARRAEEMLASLQKGK
jgi:tetratricopeptide (TPR) repeat protein